MMVWVSRRRYWLVLGDTGSVWSGTGSYMMILGQYGSILVSTWWDGLIYNGTGSEEGGTG